MRFNIVESRVHLNFLFFIFYFVCPPIWQVRELAEKHLLPTRARKDSQGICFLGKLKFDEFIEHYLGEKEGPIRSYETGVM